MNGNNLKKKSARSLKLLLALGALPLSGFSLVSTLPVMAQSEVEETAEKDSENYLLHASATATDWYEKMEAYSPAKAVDGNPETRWATSNKIPGADLEAVMDGPVTVNCLDFREYSKDSDHLGPNVGFVTVYGRNSDYEDWVELSGQKTQVRSNRTMVFFDETTIRRVKVHLTTKDPQPGINITEIGLYKLADRILPEPSTEPTPQQKQMVDDGYTMFVHFGINTFAGSEWTYGDVPVSTYAPSAIDADQWVKTVKEAGMKTILLITKHHDGFCLWDSAYTTYDVGNPDAGSHIDVIKAVSEACEKYDVKLGLYYSA